MSFRKYEKYKESGVEWLGEVPKHWVIGHLRWFISIKSGEGLPNSQVSKKPLDGENYCVMGSNGTLGYSKSFNTLPKAFAIGRVGSCGEVHFLKEKCWVTDNALKVSKWEGFNDSYFEYMLRAANLKQYANQSVQPLITGEQVKALPVPRLPLEEQKQIAAFLDKETTKIDTLLDKQEQLITLLLEKRQAIISHAVTRGLNPNVKMKDSGIEWLGEVPEHWIVKKLGYIATKIGSGKTPRGGSKVYLEEGILFLRSQNVHDTGLILKKTETVYISEEMDSEMSATRVKPGDILLNITGASIGRTCIVPADFQPANVNQHVCIIRVPKELQCYLSYFLKSVFVKSQIDAFQNGASREGLNFEQIAQIVLCLPPSSVEILEIVNRLQNDLRLIDQLLAKTESAINLLKERRTALISAAVTGKIDVRKAV